MTGQRVRGFGDLVTAIDQLGERPVTIVAISGFGGAGKSTLADRLVAHHRDSTLVRLDDFLVDHGEGPGWRGGFDWDRLMAVLADARAGRPLRYATYVWVDDRLSDELVEEPVRPLVFVEGVRLLQPDLAERFDLTIWIDVSLDVATERGIARDCEVKEWAPDELVAHLRLWHESWVPKDQAYAEACQPRDLADIRYVDDGSD